MNSLKLIPFAGGPPTEKPLAEWSIHDLFDGAFRSLVADELNLSVAGAGVALADVPFRYRDRVLLSLDGEKFFHGYITTPAGRAGSDASESVAIKVAGPFWYLEELPYRQAFQNLTAFDVNNQPVYETVYLSSFELNLPLVQAFTPVGPFTPFPSVVYNYTQLKSRDQIKAILDYAIANGAYIAYDDADILDVPVIPRTVLNISCADAIRAQLEDVDAVAWFDHTQDPPKFHCQQRKDLPPFMRELGDAHEVPGFNLQRRYDLAVPSVTLIFLQPVNVGGLNYVQPVVKIWPDPLPADQLKALVASIPLRAISGTVQEQFIKTESIQPSSIDWWKRRKPEMDPAYNPRADIEYADLELLGWSQITTLPNMIVDGAYCEWMGGHVGEDNIIGQFKYHRRSSTNLPGAKISTHTVRANITATSLNFPSGVLYSFTDISSAGEDVNAFNDLPRLIYEDLNAGQWEGTVPLWEKQYSGEIVMGKTFNLAGGRAEWETMNALVQEIGFRVREGSLHYTLRLGVNKKLSAQQFADRNRIARVRYTNAWRFLPNGSNSRTKHPRKQMSNAISDAQPEHAEINLYDA